MEFRASVEVTEEGGYFATCEDPQASARGLSRESALAALRAEIRYRIEMCPCSSVDDDYVQLRID